MIVRIHHVTQAVADLPACAHTLEQMGYGTFREFRSRSTNADIVLMTHPTAVGVELFRFADPTSAAAQEMRHHLALECTDLEADLASRLAVGGELVREIGEGIPVKRFCFIKDDTGNLIELVEAWPEELSARAA